MARKPTVAEERRHLAFARKQLRLDDLTPERRAVLEEKARTISARLAGKCEVCGRALRDPDSVARGMGSYCSHQVAA